jgi:hypothetical protein
MSYVNSLENRFGRFAIPGLIAILAGFEAVVWILLKLQPEFLSALVLDRDLVLSGQVWRLITWVFIPTSANVLWMLITVMVMLTISGIMEQAWGAFRVNLYIYGGIFSMIIGAMVFNSPPVGLTLFTSIFLAFACLVPDFEFMLFFVIPVKVKYLAMVSGALLILAFIDSPAMRGSIAFSLVNFFVAFGPGFFKGMKQRAEVTERRARFEAAKSPETVTFHKCLQCGKTELDDRHLDFRVTDDGEEYCTVCRPRAGGPQPSNL